MAAKPQIKTFEVRGQKYRTTLLPATQARGLYFRLMKSFGSGLSGLDLSKGEQMAGLGFVAGAIEGLDQPLFEDLCDAFGDVTFALRADGEDHLTKGDGFDNHFTGRYDLMTDWLLEQVKINGMLRFLSEILAKLHAQKSAGTTNP